MSSNCTALPHALDCTVTGLGDFGTDMGSFLTNLTPGVVGFIVVLAIIGGVVAIVMAIAYLIKKKLK